MREGWREVRLGDLADVSWGDTNVTKKSYSESGFAAYSATGQDGFLPYFDFDQTGFVVSAIGAQCGKTWLAKGKWACIKNTIRVIASEDSVADIEFLYWALCDPSRWPRRGSAQPFISQADARSIRVRMPPLDEQRRIAGVLGALDDLIETNRRLAENVDKAASAIALRALGRSPTTIALADVADHLPGKYLAKGKYVPTGEVIVYGSNSIMGRYSESLYDGPLTILARIGSNCGALRLSTSGAWVNNNASAIKAHEGRPAFWIHAALEQIDMDRHRGGSGQPFIRIDSLMQESIGWADQELVASTDERLGELASASASLTRESAALVTTRDELLPLLMSGAVSPGEVEVAS